MIRRVGSIGIKRNLCNRSLARQFLRQTVLRSFCVEPSVPNRAKKEPLYVGTFGNILKLLRRVSLASATLSVTSLPVMMLITGSNPSLGTSVILGTAVFMATGSTLFLKLMSYPYVTRLEEMPSSSAGDRTFVATRLNMFGFEYPTEFKLSEIEHVKVTQHPFASFRAKSDCFFVFEKMIAEEGLRDSFDNDKLLKIAQDEGRAGGVRNSSNTPK